jgi:Arc/MetJ family transcription regulator
MNRGGVAFASSPQRSASIHIGRLGLSLRAGRPTHPYTCLHIVVYHVGMSRTNVEIDDELVAAAQRMYRLGSKKSAVDLALRRLVGEPLGREEALGLQGSGFDFTNDEVESFSDSDVQLGDEP